MGTTRTNKPLTDDEITEVRRLHAEGHGRNEIARRLDRGTRTISVLCARLHLTFDRTATEVATAARVADIAEKRSILADALVDDALRLSAQMWEPAYVYNIGGKDNTFTKEDVPEPPPADKRALMSAAATASAQSLRLVPAEAETEGMAAVDQWLRGMMGGTPAPE